MVGGVFPLLVAIPRRVELPNLMLGAANLAAIILEDEPLATPWGGSDYSQITAQVFNLHT